jgi:hypothetical protein
MEYVVPTAEEDDPPQGLLPRAVGAAAVLDDRALQHTFP